MDSELEWHLRAEELCFQEEEQRVAKSFVFNVIKSNLEISELFNNGSFWSSKSVNIIFRISDDDGVAFIAGKKLGKAHDRNFAKRRLRHLYRENRNLFSKKEVLLISKKSLLTEDFAKINQQIKRFRVREHAKYN